MDGFTTTLLTACGGALCATIAALWLALNKSNDKNDGIRDAYEQKFIDLLRQQIDATNASINQTNSFTASLNSLIAIITTLKDKTGGGEK